MAGLLHGRREVNGTNWTGSRLIGHLVREESKFPITPLTRTLPEIFPYALILLAVTMIEDREIVIGNRGSDHVSLHVRQHDPEGWARADIEVRCDGWIGSVRACFMKGELARFAEGIRGLHRDLNGAAELNPWNQISR